MRPVACLIVSLLATTILGACSTQGLYEGIRQENVRRQNAPGRDVSPDPAAPSYDAYNKERERVLKESRP
ncbi:MAG TPA: hypothetical protein PLN96_13780 [Zoogloea sp.]|uniref:hypothetical protein n=1 Tax=Zoogloea sp. TaxID=49181 RepID=UPI002CDB5693|nr:hypothetical protein [Zoogloea sp.]HMV16896.1 hypothetical protein [Rhodocyclaceae bacterium]HMV61844.1 hypothetical protein [Rhodocyclaceae bacterium]HMW53771.1 hypothetical protein [Rhodocyclaceae bacterium]HMY50238.1 hypothetical protein [Rhodocyclaceae bacterium]HMZ77150.1 hypothetical protein [Rhodocyclaceae bacterium]